MDNLEAFDGDLEVGGKTVKLVIYGDKALKRVVFYFHGYPGSRLEAGIMHSYAEESGISVVAIDRPGFGGSAFDPLRKLDDWPDLVREVADKLGVSKFSICAVSGGTPYALSCLEPLGNRVDFMLIVSGLSSVRKEKKSLKKAAWPIRMILSIGSRSAFLAQTMILPLALVARKNPRLIVKMGRAILGPADDKILADGAVIELLTENIKEAFAQGIQGVLHDLAILLSPWNLKHPQSETSVLFLHGDKDLFVPPEMARQNALLVKHSQCHFLPDQGHFMAFVLGELVAEILKNKTLPAEVETVIPAV